MLRIGHWPISGRSRQQYNIGLIRRKLQYMDHPTNEWFSSPIHMVQDGYYVCNSNISATLVHDVRCPQRDSTEVRTTSCTTQAFRSLSTTFSPQLRMRRLDVWLLADEPKSISDVETFNASSEQLQALYREIKSVRFVTVSLIPHAPMKSPYFATRDWM